MKLSFKKLQIALFSAALLLTGCGQPAQESPKPAETTPAITQNETRTFVDSVGREVEVPTHITKVAVTGPLAQIAVFALADNELVGWSKDWSKDAKEFIDKKYMDLPTLGQLYGGKGELNLETLLKVDPDVVIDWGEPKKTIKEDLDQLQQQIGIPFVHITATISTLGDAYRKLGDLLEKKEEAEKLATYCDTTYQEMSDLAKSATKKKILYCSGDDGLSIVPKGSFHAEVFDLMADNVGVVEKKSSSGNGNKVDFEQIMNWDPDFIIFAPKSIYDSVSKDQSWSSIKAIQDGNYVEVPSIPYNWLGFPPSSQRLLGMMWMGKVLYNEQANYDLFEKTKEFFDLFYHSSLNQDQYNKLVKNSERFLK